ncbi:MAG: hypothetical protein HY291_08830 [Planctomycetes bacterium]|nr:hypothetical protein [Planctomycetota bacterium]
MRYDATPRILGLFGFSHSPEGRGTALAHFKGWLGARKNVEDVAPEALARMCENFLYWKSGETAPAPFERYDHRAVTTLPAGIFRRGAWCVGLSAMKATNPEDPVYRENPFALDRQKLFSVWHEKTGMILDGSHSKNQPENSTFCAESTDKNSAAPAAMTADYYPSGGAAGEDDADWVVQATYKTFFGTVRIRPITENALQIDLSVDHAACNCPIRAGFTLKPRESLLSGLSGKTVKLEESSVEATGKELGGGFQIGSVIVKGPEEMRVAWPLSHFNSYAADHKAGLGAALLRVYVDLTTKQNRVTFVVGIAK